MRALSRSVGFASLLVSLVAAAVFAACSGPDGPAGPPGPAGPAGSQGGTGAGGPTGSNGTSVDGGEAIPVSCLSPCHAFGGVVDQYKSSAHYTTYLTTAGSATADEWTTPGVACGNCHAEDALAQRVAGNVGTAHGGAVASTKTGELQYRDPQTGALSDSTYAGNAAVARVYCTTCHAVNATNDPHRTGKPFTPGSFPLQVPAGASDFASIEKSPSTSAVAGTSAGIRGSANTCIFCHKSRKDVTSYIGASNVIGSVYWGPHEGPQADVFTAKGGYPYAGKSYGTSTHEQKLTCVDCHMPDVKENAGVPDHSFNARLSACQSCHSGANSFDINGGQSLIKSALTELETALNNAGYLTRSPSAPYGPLATSQIGDGSFELDQPRPGAGPDGGATVLTADQAGALYNFIIVARGGALGAHNPKYVQQLLFDSYVAITGQPPTSIPRP